MCQPARAINQSYQPLPLVQQWGSLGCHRNRFKPGSLPLCCSLICPAPTPPQKTVTSRRLCCLTGILCRDEARERAHAAQTCIHSSCFLCFVLGLFVIPSFLSSPHAHLFPLSAPCHFPYLFLLSRSNVPIPLLLIYLSPHLPESHRIKRACQTIRRDICLRTRLQISSTQR